MQESPVPQAFLRSRHLGLAEVLGQFLGEDARNDVVAAAGGKADNNVDRPRRISCGIVFRRGGASGKEQARSH